MSSIQTSLRSYKLKILSVLKTVSCQLVMSSIQTSLRSYKLKILSVLKMVSCQSVMSGLENQMAEQILQRCPLLQTARTNVWPTAVQLHTKLQGSKEELGKTATFILPTGLSVERESRRKIDSKCFSLRTKRNKKLSFIKPWVFSTFQRTVKLLTKHKSKIMVTLYM